MKLVFHPEVKRDIASLDGSVKGPLREALQKIKNMPGLGRPLHNKRNLNLANCVKMYFHRKRYRIVYEVPDDQQIVVWSIGKREDDLVYVQAYRRMLTAKNNSHREAR